MENAKKFFEEIVKTEEAKALFAAIEAPETEEARIAAYVEIAAKLGVQLDADEICAYLKSVDPDSSAELDDEELSQLVGGGENAQCSSTYQHKENCWWSDGCDRVNNSYDGYLCSDQNYGQKREDRERGLIVGKAFPVCKMPYIEKALDEAGYKLDSK